MSDELALRKSMDRAAKAKALIEDEMLAGAFAELESALTQAWKESQPRDNDGRERAWQAIQLVGKVREALRQTMDAGHLAAEQLRRMGLI